MYTFHLYMFLSMIFNLKFSFLFLCTIHSSKQNLILQIVFISSHFAKFYKLSQLIKKKKKKTIGFVHYLVILCVYINFPET